MTDDAGLTTTALWLAYGLASSLALYQLRALRASTGLKLACATLFSVIDLLVPFTFRGAQDAIAISVVVFLFPVCRPTKLLLYALDQGPLAIQHSIQQYVLTASLPIIPLRCLPERVQRRMRVLQPSAWTVCKMAVAVGGVLLGALMTRAYEPVSGSTVRSCFAHIISFVGFLVLLLEGAAVAALALGSEPLVRPFNSFLMAASINDWWSFRWDTVISLTLRLSVYDPLTWLVLRLGGDPSTAKIVPGLATFGMSALVHEYTLFALTRNVQGIGQVSKFFLVQPILVVVEHLLRRSFRWMLTRASVWHHNTEKALAHAITVCLVLGSVCIWWCPAYDPPVSIANERVADAVLRLAGLCEQAPYCKAHNL
jgi:Membrane bound O-acyl transferase family